MKKILLVMLLLGFVVYADEKPKYEPTEVQALRLQVKQKDAQLAQRDAVAAQQHFMQTIQALNDEANKIKTENKWGEKVQFNPDTLTFSDIPSEPSK